MFFFTFPTFTAYLHDAASLDTADPMERRARLPSPKYLQLARSLPTNWSEPVEVVALVQVCLRRNVPVRVKPSTRHPVKQPLQDDQGTKQLERK